MIVLRLLRQGVLLFLELLLQGRQLAVAKLGQAAQVVVALGKLHLVLDLVDLLLDGTHAQDRLLFRLPLVLEFLFLLLQLLLLFGHMRELLLRGVVRLLLQRLLSDLKLHDLAPRLVQRLRHRLDLRAQLRRCLVDEVDRLVGQESVRNVTVGERRRRQERVVADAHAVMHLVTLLDAAQDRDRVLDRRLADHDRLEAALKSRVLLDVLAILAQGRRADAAQLAACKHRLQEIACVHRALSRTRADDRMHFIDEEQDLTVRLRDLVQDRLQAFLKLAAELCARNERTHVERVERLILQRFRHIARHDAACQPLDNRRLADARLADEHRVVLRAARQDLDRAANLLVAADHGIDLALLRRIREIAPVLFERLVALLGIAARDVLLAVLLDGIHDAALRKAELATDLLHLIAAVSSNAEQQMLRADVVVLHALGVFLRPADDAHHVHAHRQTILSLDARQLAKLLFQPCAQHRLIRAAVLEDRCKQSLRLLHERIEQMRRRDFLLIAHGRRLLRRLHRRQSLLRISFFTHNFFLLYINDDFLRNYKASFTSPCYFLL